MSATEITNIVLRFFAAVDERAWDTALGLMTDAFHLDYSSFGAGPAADLAPGDIIEGWKGLLPGFDATHHQLGALNVVAEDATAKVRANGTATHFIENAGGAPVWVVVGSYDIGLTKIGGDWRLSSLTFNFKYQDGNTNLPAMATLRAKPETSE